MKFSSISKRKESATSPSGQASFSFGDPYTPQNWYKTDTGEIRSVPRNAPVRIVSAADLVRLKAMMQHGSGDIPRTLSPIFSRQALAQNFVTPGHLYQPRTWFKIGSGGPGSGRRRRSSTAVRRRTPVKRRSVTRRGITSKRKRTATRTYKPKRISNIFKLGFF